MVLLKLMSITGKILLLLAGPGFQLLFVSYSEILYCYRFNFER